MLNYESLSKALNYWDLCYIEDALLEYNKAHPPKDENERKNYEELITSISTARGWVHHLNKTQHR